VAGVVERLRVRFERNVARPLGAGCWRYANATVCQGAQHYHPAFVAWVLTHGPLKPGQYLTRTCETADCCRPEHHTVVYRDATSPPEPPQSEPVGGTALCTACGVPLTRSSREDHHAPVPERCGGTALLAAWPSGLATLLRHALLAMAGSSPPRLDSDRWGPFALLPGWFGAACEALAELPAGQRRAGTLLLCKLVAHGYDVDARRGAESEAPGGVPHVPLTGASLAAVCAWLARGDRAHRIERIHHGMEKARRAGTHLGRPPVAVDVEATRQAFAQAGSLRKAAKLLGCSEATVRNRLRAV
jgi:hypothetical protein